MRLALEQRDSAAVEERIVFSLRTDQARALRDEADRQAHAHRSHTTKRSLTRPNVSQVIRDALVAAGIIPP
jgi:hypothetical protein